MALSMFNNQPSPIALDLGASSLKLLQLTSAETPEIIAAAELPVPDSIRSNQTAQFEYFTEHLPKMLSKGKFKNRRIVIAIPSAQSFIQHLQLPKTEDEEAFTTQLNQQLQTQVGCSPDNVVTRSIKVGNVAKHGQSRSEVICFAMAKRTVMRYIELLKRLKLEVVGVQTEMISMVRAFDHLNRRNEDANITTMYIDFGWSGTRIAVAHGSDITFARHVQIGGRDFDQFLMDELRCQPAEARAHRIALSEPVMRTKSNQAASKQATALLSAASEAKAREHLDPADNSSAAAVAPDRRTNQNPDELAFEMSPRNAIASSMGNVDLSELTDTITDEICMSLRYHQSLFPGRAIDRVIFLGGESRQQWLTQSIIRKLRLPGNLGDPLVRIKNDQARTTPGLELNTPQPGWAVACGLCLAPTEL